MTATAHDPLPPSVVIAATPTSNGDLHVGHLAGPYLAGDIWARWRALTGRPVVYSTVTDDSQSYVATTAARRGLSPADLAATSTAQIAASVAAAGLSMPGLPPVDERYARTVRDFVLELHRRGAFRLREVKLPYATSAGQFLYDGLLSGSCPTCLAGSSGGGCESCGHPNHFDDLLEPRSALDPADPVELRTAKVLVLPLEEYRDRLAAHYAAHRDTWRPHARQLVAELLAGPLPEVPVTVPGVWGQPAPFPETPGQVLYPWVEAMPASMYSTWWAAAEQGLAAERTDHWWRAETGAEIVFFHGFDNVYAWGMVDLALLMAHGDTYTLPVGNVCNEFYELSGSKFSTSRNHLVWTRDLLADVPRDLVRFHLALTGPEQQRTSFDLAALREVADRRLVGPWNLLRENLARLTAGVLELPTTPAGRRRASAMAARFAGCYALDSFSPSRAAETLAEHVQRLAVATSATAPAPAGAALGDLLLQVRTLVAGAAPVLVDATAATGLPLTFEVTATAVTAFALPELPARVPALTTAP
jgi:methionyl-tRNA synthetase